MKVTGYVMVDEAGSALSVSVGGGADLIKSHIQGYTRKDGTFVKEHDDKRQAKAGGDDHPLVVGRPSKMVSYQHVPGQGSREVEPEHPADADVIHFGGKQYSWTSGTGRSVHDQTPLRAYEHEESRHKVWMDEQGRVHADSKSEVDGLRAAHEASGKPEADGKDGKPAAKPKRVAVRKEKDEAAAPSPAADEPHSPQATANEAKWNDLDDEENPHAALPGLSSKALAQLAGGHVDGKAHAARELASRGQDLDGKWVGHAKAKEAHAGASKGEAHPEIAEHLQTVHTKVLTAAAKGHLDMQRLAKQALASRGHDASGKWVGFDKAKQVHGV